MLPEIYVNDVVIAPDLRVYYYKDNTSTFPFFSTSKDKYDSLFSDPQNYFKHLVSNDHVGAQFMTDNFDLVLRQESGLHKLGESPRFDHYAEDINTEVTIQNRVNVAVFNNEKVLFIKNLTYEPSESLYNKIIKLHKVLQC